MQNLSLPTLTNDLYSDSTKSIFRYVIYVTQKKLHTKKEEKLLKRFWDRPPPPLNLDGRMDRRTTDKSVLEKLGCLSAGGAKNWSVTFLHFGMNLPKDGTNQLPKAGFDWITLKVIFQGRKGLNLPFFSNFGTYCPFIQNLFGNFFVLIWNGEKCHQKWVQSSKMAVRNK